MRLTVSAAILREHVAVAKQFISPRPSLPVLSNILIGAKGDRLTFYATDVDSSIMTTAEVGDCEEGRITLPAKQLGDLVHKLPNADVVITCDNEVDVTLRCMRSKFTLRGYKPSEYPDPIKPTGKPALTLPARTLAGIIAQVLYACKGEEGSLAGIHLILEGGRLVAMGADGYRMAIWDDEAPAAKGKFRDTVPTRLLRELASLLKASPEGEVSIYKHGDNLIGFAVGESYLAGRLVAQAYPDFRPVIPTSFEQTTTLNRAAFLGAVERVSVMTAGGEMANIVVAITGTDLTITASGNDAGDGEEVVACSAPDADFTIAMRAPWLVDALKSLPGEEVTIGFASKTSPIVLRPFGGENVTPPLTAVVMPVVV